MKLYTKTGDQGNTDVKGRRIAKDDVIIKVIGEIDDFQAEIGLAYSVSINHIDNSLISNILHKISHELYLIMGYFSGYVELPTFDLEKMENTIDSLTNMTPPHPGKFVIPGIYELDARLNKCRTVCRRVERKLTKIKATELIPYFNRSSDLLYAMQIYAMTSTNTSKGNEPYEINTM